MYLLYEKIRVAFKLGIKNLFRILWYRLGIRLRLNQVIKIRAEIPQAPFFLKQKYNNINIKSTGLWESEAKLFSYWPVIISNEAPNWLKNYLTGKRYSYQKQPWWEIPDFDKNVGDIKLIWELSRFDWVLAFVQRVRNGDELSFLRLNQWLADWCKKNPPYYGPNWKCGQEASIRVMHLAIGAMILKETALPQKALIDLIRLHLQRIAPTITYSIAQDNNHGTSEAAALFIGGSWLVSIGYNDAHKWANTGRRMLENRIKRLVDQDGGFSQYSVNYHRLMLDTISMVEVWRRHLDLPIFSQIFYSRANSACLWLACIVNHVTGDAPNIGANDGARLLQLTDTDYRDFRPSVQLAAVLFIGKRVYIKDGSWNDQLRWLGISVPSSVCEPLESRLFDGTGYVVLKKKETMIVLRYPRFRFRPCHADALHLDLWQNGKNLLRDSGSYSYNADKRWLDYFPGTESHNTVQFDDRDQMPRVSRFLFGSWLKNKAVTLSDKENGCSSCVASYKDSYGAFHRRTVSLTDTHLSVHDQVSGFQKKAVLRWRLIPGPWVLDGQIISDCKHRIVITSDVVLSRIELCSGWESRYYNQKNSLPVLEAEINSEGHIMTEYYY
jgi:hypothetical protein